LRSNDDQLAEAVRTKLRELDAGLPIYVQPWSKALDGVLFGWRMATLSLGVLGMLGAMLSITGMFGMGAYSVSKRNKELGIRMVLGAHRKEVRKCCRPRWVTP